MDDIDQSIRDIARMVRPDGYAIVIFPCGNEGSLLDRTMRLMRDSRTPTAEGRTILFFEADDGHVRRMTSSETVAIFERNGFEVVTQLFSGHFFGTADWLCRGTNSGYINKVFRGRPAIDWLAGVRLELTRQVLLVVCRLVSKRSLDLAKRRGALKQVAAVTVKTAASMADRILTGLSSLEWRLRKHQPQGSAQYLVFRKRQSLDREWVRGKFTDTTSA